MPEIRAHAWRRFSVRRFSVETALLGKNHVFTHSGRNVEIKLPAGKRTEDGTIQDDDHVKCWKWQKTNGLQIPLAFSIADVDVSIEIGGQLDVPAQALEVPPRRDELFTERQKTQLDLIEAEYAGLIKDVFQLWLRVLRWKARAPHLNEPTVSTEEGSYSTYLRNSADRHRFWMGPRVMVAQAENVITSKDWEAAENALLSESLPPIWFEYVFDALQRLSNQDEVGSVLSAAIGFELMMRGLLTRHLSAETANQKIVTTLLHQVNRRAIVNRVKDIKYWNREWEKTFNNSEFNELMNFRDAIMHRADTKALRGKDLRKMYSVLLQFAYFMDSIAN
jgi:hypothetical protein